MSRDWAEQTSGLFYNMSLFGPVRTTSVFALFVTFTLFLAVSIAGIIAQSYGVLCEAESFNWRFASVWLSAIDFVSIRCACSSSSSISH